MCGICGIFNYDPEAVVDEAVLRRMGDRLVHRGPDGEGYALFGSAGLGHRRLKIIDAATGRQPMSNESGTIRIACNGEIYNHLDLRRRLEGAGHTFRTRSDTEAILHLYEEEGLEALESLNGIFAFALWDARARRLLLARDRFGVKPYHHPEILDSLYELSPEHRLMGYVDRALFAGVSMTWEGSIDELRTVLQDEDSPLSYHEKQKLPKGTWIGQDLKKLSCRYPRRFQSERDTKTGRVVWTLRRNPNE